MSRLNSKYVVREITEIRIRQGQKISSCTSSIWKEKLEDDELKLLKNNLASLLIQDNLRLGLEILTNKEKWITKASGTPIKSLLQKKTFIRAAKALEDLNIILLEQILDKEGQCLLTWQQLKASRKRSKKGAKATWFKEIEERVLKDKGKQEVSDSFKTSCRNLLGPKNLLEKISTDRRKQEWVIYEDSLDQKSKIDRIRKKTKNNVLIEH